MEKLKEAALFKAASFLILGFILSDNEIFIPAPCFSFHGSRDP